MQMAAVASKAAREAPHKLVSIRFSHYNEKARWIMDWHQVPYVERPYLPFLSTWGVVVNGGLLTGKMDRVSTRFSTPYLSTNDGKRLHDSRQIVKYIDERYSTPETTVLNHADAVKLEDHYHDYLGPHTRRLAYFHLLKDEGAFFDMCRGNVSAAQFQVFRAVWPFAKGMLNNLGLTADKAAKSHSYITKEFDDVADRLSKHRGDFILGDRFSAADLAFASLAAPILVVQPWEGFGGYYPPVEELPDDLRDVVKEFRSHPAGQFAIRMFRQHRGHRQIPGEPPLILEPPHDIYGRPDDKGGKRSGRLGPGIAMK